MAQFGFIQGRVTKTPSKKILQYFPVNSWRNEFSIAPKLKFNFIEYFGERIKNLKNPIWSKNGLKEINYLNKINRLRSHTFCDDFFIHHKLLSYPESENYFKNLRKNLSIIGVKIYVLALFEKSEIKKNNLDKYIPKLKKISKIFHEKKIKLALESNLDAELIIKLIKLIKSKNTFIVYDTGNRLKRNNLQYNEILKLKKNICHFHIKDKNWKGENVVLGKGAVNFNKIFNAVKKIKYRGKFTFETNRGKDPFITMKKNKEFIKKYYKKII